MYFVFSVIGVRQRPYGGTSLYSWKGCEQSSCQIACEWTLFSGIKNSQMTAVHFRNKDNNFNTSKTLLLLKKIRIGRLNRVDPLFQVRLASLSIPSRLTPCQNRKRINMSMASTASFSFFLLFFISVFVCHLFPRFFFCILLVLLFPVPSFLLLCIIPDQPPCAH